MYLFLVEAMTKCAKLVYVIFYQKLILNEIWLEAEENLKNQLCKGHFWD